MRKTTLRHITSSAQNLRKRENLPSSHCEKRAADKGTKTKIQQISCQKQCKREKSGKKYLMYGKIKTVFPRVYIQ